MQSGANQSHVQPFRTDSAATVRSTRPGNCIAAVLVVDRRPALEPAMLSRAVRPGGRRSQSLAYYELLAPLDADHHSTNGRLVVRAGDCAPLRAGVESSVSGEYCAGIDTHLLRVGAHRLIPLSRGDSTRKDARIGLLEKDHEIRVVFGFAWLIAICSTAIVPNTAVRFETRCSR